MRKIQAKNQKYKATIIATHQKNQRMKQVVKKHKLVHAAQRETQSLKARNYKSHVDQLERDLVEARAKPRTGLAGGRGGDGGGDGGDGGGDGAGGVTSYLSQRSSQISAIQERLSQLETTDTAAAALAAAGEGGESMASREGPETELTTEDGRDE